MPLTTSILLLTSTKAIHFKPPEVIAEDQSSYWYGIVLELLDDIPLVGVYWGEIKICIRREVDPPILQPPSCYKASVYGVKSKQRGF
jgi:hypothetical protein